jgi:hypothetical protein
MKGVVLCIMIITAHEVFGTANQEREELLSAIQEFKSLVAEIDGKEFLDQERTLYKEKFALSIDRARKHLDHFTFEDIDEIDDWIEKNHPNVSQNLIALADTASFLLEFGLQRFAQSLSSLNNER